MISRNPNAVVWFWREPEDGINSIGLGSHMTRAAVDERLPKAIEFAGFSSGQGVRVYGSAAQTGRDILGVVGVEFSPTPDPLALLRFTHALVGEVSTVQTVDVVRVAEPPCTDSSVVNRVSVADVNTMLAALTLQG